MKRLTFILMLIVICAFGVYADTLPDAPSGFTIGSPTTTTLILSWINNQAESFFDSTKIYTMSDTTWVAAVDSSLATVTITSLTPGTEYAYFARADSSDETADSNGDTLRTAYPQIKTLSGLDKMQNAVSWGRTTIIDTCLVNQTGTDSSNVVIIEPYMWWQGIVAGTTVEAVARFYSGVCNGPFAVTLQDTLTLAEGLNYKRLWWGGRQGYVVFAGKGSNGEDTTISDSYWMSWTSKE